VTFLAPLWLAAAAASVLGAVALHLITTQRPPAAPLPTARFVPAGDARASSRAARPTDLLLLLLRCAALLLLGTAFAGPVARAASTTFARVIVVDRSRGTLADTRDSALAVLHSAGAAAGVVIVFDSSATAIDAGASDSLTALTPAPRRGSLSAALVSARRAASGLALHTDSIELVIVSPLTTDEIDAASALMVSHWPGRVRLVRTASAKPAAAAVTLAGDDADDPLRPAIAALNASNGPAARSMMRVERGALTAADSAAARRGAAVVSWPVSRVSAPMAQGVWAGTATLVAPLARLALPADGRTVARWADGAPAAVEQPLGRGCVRSIGIGVPTAGDVALQSAFMAVARALLAPCDGVGAGAAASDSVGRAFARTGPAAPAASLQAPDEGSPLAPWLIGAALVLLGAELFVRRGTARVAA
jgi:hypothetical protein